MQLEEGTSFKPLHVDSMPLVRHPSSQKIVPLDQQPVMLKKSDKWAVGTMGSPLHVAIQQLSNLPDFTVDCLKTC